MAFALLLTAVVPGFVQSNNTRVEANTITKQTVIVHANDVALRYGSSNSSTKIMSLNYGNNFEYGGAIVNGFYRVKVPTSLQPSGYAFISTNYAALINPSSTTSAYLYTNTSVRLRTEPNTNCSSYMVLPAGTLAPIVTSNTKFVYTNTNSADDDHGLIWAKVYYSGKQVGYVNVAYFQTVNNMPNNNIMLTSYANVYTPPITTYDPDVAKSYILSHITSMGPS